MPRAQALSRKSPSQNFGFLLSPLAFSTFPKTSAAKRKHTPSTRRSGKDLVTGKIFSTTAQTYSLSALPSCSLSHTLLLCLLCVPSAAFAHHFLLPSSCWLLLQASVSTQCRSVPPHGPSHYRLPPSLN